MHFYFQIQDGSGQRDERGQEFPTLAKARLEVERLAMAALADRPEAVWKGNGWSIDVTDEQGLLLFALHLFSSISPRVKRLVDIDRTTQGSTASAGAAAKIPH